MARKFVNSPLPPCQAEQTRARAAESASPPLPPGLPNWITVERIQDTINTFQPYYPNHPLTLTDAAEILLSAGQVFGLFKGEPSHETIQSAAA